MAGKTARRKLRSVSLCVILAGFNAGHAIAQDIARPVGRASALDATPVLDGDVLGDPAWQGVTPITGFTQSQPNAGQPASQRTEVFIGVTDSALHIGVVAYDSDPDAIITTDSRRDSSLDDTDSFRVLIDGLLDRQNGFIFGTNPASVEFDGQVSREGAGQNTFGGDGGLNLNWDASWTVTLENFGYRLEFGNADSVLVTSLWYGRRADLGL